MSVLNFQGNSSHLNTIISEFPADTWHFEDSRQHLPKQNSTQNHISGLLLHRSNIGMKIRLPSLNRLDHINKEPLSPGLDSERREEQQGAYRSTLFPLWAGALGQFSPMHSEIGTRGRVWIEIFYDSMLFFRVTQQI